MLNIREVIITSLGSFFLDFDETTVSMLEEKVRRVKDKNRNVNRVAYIVARNWAIDRIRRKKAAIRRKTISLLTAETARKEAERRERCRLEFEGIVLKLAPYLHHTQPEQLAVVRLVHFEGGLPLSRFSELFTGATKYQRYQWITRGMRLVLPQASQELRELLRGSVS